MPRLTTVLLPTLGAVALAIGLIGCRSDEAPSAGVGTVDASGDWQLASGTVDGIPVPVVADTPITLTVEGTRIGGRSPCNDYGGEIVVEAGRTRYRTTSMTQVACQEPAMRAEAAYLAALERITGATRDGDRLTLTGIDVQLHFDRLAPPPLAELVGTNWVLESIIKGEAVSSVGGQPATLRLDAGGTFAGSTGCRTFSGRWVSANGGITPTDLAMDGSECPPDLAEQDGHIVGILERFRASVDGRRLTLTGDGGDGLIYTAAD